MSQIQTIQKPINDRRRSELIFAGQLLVFENVDAMRELVVFTKELITSKFGLPHPQRAHEHLSRDQFLQCAYEAQKTFKTSDNANNLLTRCLEQTGVDLNTCYRDKFVLRILPPVSTHPRGRHSSVHVHRDTWGSNLHQQINWWAPIYPLQRDNTLAIYPAHWQKPVANNSDEWCFSEVIHDRQKTPKMLAGHYPAAPIVSNEVDKHDEVRVIIEPGSLFCFSGAHLHGGLANTTDETRFSIETRTIHLEDIADGRSAPNIDCHATKQYPQWFHHIIDTTSLADVI